MLIKAAHALDLNKEYAPGKALGGSSATLSTIINPLIENIIIVSGLLAFGAIFLSGFLYITGSGDKGKTQQAANMLNYAIIGLIIVTAAFVITKLTGNLIGFDFF